MPKLSIPFLFSIFAVGIFFAPYLAGTRLRAEILLGYICAVVVWIAILQRGGRLEKREAILLLLSGICLIVTIAFTLIAPLSFFERIKIVTNYNFIVLSLLIYLTCKNTLVRTRLHMVRVALAISIVVNVIALYQWIDPTSPINMSIYSMYGGEPGAIAVNLGYSSNSEFLVLAAKRYTSIFIGMHVLALFNLLVLAIAGHIFINKGIDKTLDVSKALVIVAMSGAVLGGVLSFSKTFMFGLLTLVVLHQAFSRRRRYAILAALLLVMIVPMGALTDSGERLLSILGSDALRTRYGEGGYLEGAIKDLASDPVMLAIGAGYRLNQYSLADSLYVSPILIGGIIYLMVYLMPIIFLVSWNYFEHRNGNRWATTFLVINLVFLIIGVGIPTYQVGRVAPLLIILNLSFLASVKTISPRISLTYSIR